MWNEQTEKELMEYRKNGKTYKEIAELMDTTISSVKHKVRRIQQLDNNDRYKHTAEKTAQFDALNLGKDLRILETHCGYGGMTETYLKHGTVHAMDISSQRIDYIIQNFPDAIPYKADSEIEIYKLIYEKKKFDLIDIDPYGMPSRYFPHVFNLIENGHIIITLPMIGVAQMNKITIAHLQEFWDVNYKEPETYVDKVVNKLKTYAFMCKREIELINCTRIDRIYRIVIKVEKKSMLDIVGLEVNRTKPST